MFLTTKKMDNILGAAELAITTALKDEKIKEPLLVYNWDEQRLQEGQELHRIAKQKYQTQIKERGEQFQARAELEQAYEEANPAYIEHVTLARLALKRVPAQKTKFTLKGPRRRDIYGWLEQAEVFYDNIIVDEEVIALLSRYGINAEKLQAGRDLVMKVKAANKKQEKEKSDSQNATEERNKAFQDLTDWLSEFHQVCKFALADKPQLLERLGILALSEGYKRQPAVEPDEEEEENA